MNQYMKIQEKKETKKKRMKKIIEQQNCGDHKSFVSSNETDMEVWGEEKCF